MPDLDNIAPTDASAAPATLRQLWYDPVTNAIYTLTLEQAKILIGAGGTVADQDPDVVTFTPVVDAPLSTEYISNSVTLAGITAPILISIIGGTYSINGGPFVLTDGVGFVGDDIRVKQTSADADGTVRKVFLQLGGQVNFITVEFSITTDTFWYPELFPELLSAVWYQEDVAEGVPLSNWQSRGFRPKNAVQVSPSIQPTRLPNGGGVLFQKGTRQAFAFTTEVDAPAMYRWCLVIARVNGATASAGDNQILTINGKGTTSGQFRQPCIEIDGVADTMTASIVQASPIALKAQSGAISTDWNDWNVILMYRRGRYVNINTNGTWGTPIETGSIKPNNQGSGCVIGPVSADLLADYAVDCIMLGQSELNDSQIDKFMGWAMWRKGAQARLPGGHPYFGASPDVQDASDAPYRYDHDAAAWDTFAATSGTVKYVNRGLAAPTITGYETVFEDHFLSDTVADDLSGSPAQIWFSPSWATTVGSNAALARPGDTPDCYVHDGSSGLALRLLNSSGWKTGNLCSVDNNGQGRSWTLGIFEARFKCPNLGTTWPVAGLWPAFWSYGLEHLFWRTRPRIEPDFYEGTGVHGGYFGSTLHVHKPQYSFPINPNNVGSDEDYKYAGYTIATATDADFTGAMAAFNIFDGAYHTMYMRIDDDFSYFVIDDIELVRVPTAQAFKEPKYLMASLAYNTPGTGAPADPALTYDMTIDYIRVRQLTTQLAVVPTGFSALPTIAGTKTSGSTLTITPNTSGRQISYRWYRDGFPIVTAVAATYVLAAADVGHKIRATVQNKSLVNQPLAWTAETTTIS